MSPATHIGQVPTPIPMVSSPHTPQPVISTANTSSTNPNTPVSTVTAGPNTPTPAVASPAACLDGSSLPGDAVKKEDVSSDYATMDQPPDGDPTEDVRWL